MKVRTVQKRTLEFLVKLTPQQQFIVDTSFEQLIAVWNRGLGELMKFDKFHCYDKQSKSWVQRCPVQWSYRYDDGFIPYSTILHEDSYWYQKQSTRVKISSRAEKKNSYGWVYGIGYSCPIGENYQPSVLSGTNFFSLSKVSKNEHILPLLNRIAEYQKSTYSTEHIPIVGSTYRYDCLKKLATSWQEYIKSRSKQTQSNCGIPKFKSKRFPITSMGFNNGVDKHGIRPTKPNEDTVTAVPILGTVRVKRLWKRWGNLPIIELRILKKRGKYYIQLMSDVPTIIHRTNVEKACGIDPNIINLMTLDNGKKYDNHRYLKSSEKHLQKLQKQLASKVSNRLILYLNNSSTTPQQIVDNCKSIGLEKANLLLQSKVRNDNDILKIVSASTLNKIKYSFSSNNERKLINRISRKHSLIAAKRKANDDKITTYITRTYSHIALEDTTTAKMVKRLAAIENEDNKNGYQQTGQKHKSALNKAILDSSIGRKKELFKRKSKENNTTVELINSINSTLKCPVCGNINNPINRLIICKCGWECDEDISAGVNFAIALYDKKQIKLELLSENTKEALRRREEVNSK